MRLMLLGVLLLGGCAGAMTVERECLLAGADRTRGMVRVWSEGGDIGRVHVRGCYIGRSDRITCGEGDTVCLAHEQGHRAGRFLHW